MRAEERYDMNFYAVTILMVIVTAYFFYHAFSGEKGVAALVRLDHLIEVKRAELETLESERGRMENRVARMRSDSLDLDLLEEQARRVLGYAKSNEYIIVPEGGR